MYLGDSFKSILEKHEIDLIDYDETLSDVNLHIWQRAMETKLESMHSNSIFYIVHDLYALGVAQKIQVMGVLQVDD